jgi:predicted transcriptional regulator
MHKVATGVFERAAQAGAPVAHRRGVLAVLQADGTPACKRHAEASSLAAAGANVPVSLCLGINAGADNGKDPCEFLSGCEAFAGVEREANTSDFAPAVGQVTVHALLTKAAAFAGSDLLVIDESPAVAESCTLRAEDLRHAANVRGFFKGAAARVLRGVANALATAVPGAPIECTARALLEQCTNAEDRFHVVYRPRPKLSTGETMGPPIPRSQWCPSLTPRARAAVRDASAVGEAVLRASTTLATLARLIAGTFYEELQSDQRAAGWVRVPYEETQGALVCVLGSDTLTTACARPGPTIFADATADVDVLTTLLGAGNLSVVDLHVSDGAPVERTLLYCARATRKAWIPRDDSTRWEELVPYLNAAIEIANVPDGGSLGIITFQRLERELQLAWDGSQYPHDGIERILRGLKERRVAVVFGHYGALRGRDDWTHCDALIALGTPRANVGASQAIADALAIDHHAAYKHNVAAELSQACGRLRTPWRTKRGSMVVVGNVAPLSWDARAVVRELPKGRAPVADAPAAEVPRPMTAEAFAAGLALRGWSQAVAAQAFGVSQGTVSRWLSGRQPVALAENVGWPERVESTASGMRICTAAGIAPSKISEREQRPRTCITASGMRPMRRARTTHDFEHEHPLAPALTSEPAQAPVPRTSAQLFATARALGWRSTADAVRALAPHIDGPRPRIEPQERPLASKLQIPPPHHIHPPVTDDAAARARRRDIRQPEKASARLHLSTRLERFVQLRDDGRRHRPPVRVSLRHYPAFDVRHEVHAAARAARLDAQPFTFKLDRPTSLDDFACVVKM